MDYQHEETDTEGVSKGKGRRVVGVLLLMLVTAAVAATYLIAPSNPTPVVKQSVIDASDVDAGDVSKPAASNSGSQEANPQPEEVGEPAVQLEKVIPNNALAIFPTIKLGSQSNSLPIQGGDVRWNSTSYGVLIYVPDAEHIDIMATTSSKSYSKSYVYGLTVEGRLYSVRAGTDVSRQTITELDPRTGSALGSCSIYSSDIYGEFAIVGDAVYYRSKMSKDLYGNRSGGGELMAERFPCSGEPTSLQRYGTDANSGRLYGVGGTLIMAARVDDDTYEIREINKSTGEIERVVDTVFNEFWRFFAGSDALYWREASGAGSSVILRHDLSGVAEELVTLPYSPDDMYNLGIDEEDGKVLIVFAEGINGPRHFYLYDLAEDSLDDLSIDPSLFSTYTRGNAQFLFVQ